jgi:hypothetical protein
VYDNALVRLKEPFKVSIQDLQILCATNGLEEMIPQGGQIIANKVYKSTQEQAILGMLNLHNPMEVRKFKAELELAMNHSMGSIKTSDVWPNNF